MNIKEHLLTCLIEECSEVQKDASKSLRFGVDDVNPRTMIPNGIAITTELNDLLAIVELLSDYGIIDIDNVFDRNAVELKKDKVKKYMKYAQEKGALEA